MPITLTDNSASISTSEYSLPNNSTSLTAQTDDCCLQTWIDFVNMVAGDQYQVRVYEKVDGQTKSTIFESILTGVQPGALVTPTLVVGDGWDVTVKRLAGSDRTIYWSLRKIT